MTEPAVAVVLDTGSIVAFARGDTRVAEVIVETAAQHAVVGVSAVGLLSAYGAVGADPVARARLGLLAVLPAVRVLAMTAQTVRPAAAAMPHCTDLAGVHAVWATAEHRAYYVTVDPAEAPEYLESWQIYPLAPPGAQ